MKTLTKYDILVVVLNRLYLLLVIGLHTRYGYRYLSTSRGAGNRLATYPTNCTVSVQIPIYLERGRKHFFPQSKKRVIARIDTYLPREGPETCLLPIRFGRPYRYRSLSTSRGAGNRFLPTRILRERAVGIDTYLPREGSETRHRYLMGKRIHQYSSLSTSRGAGNIKRTYFFVHFHFVQLPIYLARGRKHYHFIGYKIHLESIAPYLPREGPETFTFKATSASIRVQLPIYLERGRKYEHYYVHTDSTVVLYRYQSTSRGAGNHFLQNEVCFEGEGGYSYLSTSRGAGNKQLQQKPP